MTLRQDLFIREGETFSFTYTHLDSAGAPVDLTGYSARMAIKLSYEGSTESYLSTGSDADGGTITLGGGAGTVELGMAAAQTSSLLDEPSLFAWTAKRGEVKSTEVFKYDLELVAGDGTVTRALEGRVMVSREITVA